ncbi:putative spermidine/putrescine transport system substrate-binding protein [Pseudomonas laurylsulfatiphila]|uniref:ABC transporter substrate-binding protein n=1 Tax=Pseudomonas laurylsulfatiphila TaxID=2011015 RepID=UPI003D226452
MNHKFSLSVCGFLAGVVLASNASAQVTLVSWGGIFQDAQREVFFDPLRAEGLKIHEDSWDGGIGILRSKIMAGDSGWDLVQVEPEEMVLGCEEGLYQPLDFARIGKPSQFIPGAASECGLGANVYSIVIAYDGNVLKTGPQSWSDFWDVKKFPGKRALRQGPKMNLEFALMADGVAPDQVYSVLSTPQGVDRAFAKLEQLKPNVIWWSAGNQPMQLLGSGEVVMTTTYNGRVFAANESDKRNFKVVWNGGIFMVDSWVLLKGSKNQEDAYRFLKYFGDARNQARFPLKIRYGVANKDANQLLPAEIQAQLPSSPETLAKSVPFNAEYWLENIDSLTERFSAWSAK